MSRRALFQASDESLDEVGQDVLARTGSAVAAVAAVYFAAAVAAPSVLMSAVTVLVVGTGARAFDGRARQPGLGVKRPRGYLADGAIPSAARVAAPRGPHAVLLALTYDGSATASQVFRPALRLAKSAGRGELESFLERLRDVGVAAFRDGGVQRELLSVAGQPEGGLLTESDLAEPSLVDVDALRVGTDGEAQWVTAPWNVEDVELGRPSDGGVGHGAVAMDVHGLGAALTYRRYGDALPCPGLGVELPMVAAPVLRGVPRVAPGTCIPSPAPLGARFDADGALVEVALAPTARHLGVTDEPTIRLSRDPRTRTVTHRAS